MGRHIHNPTSPLPLLKIPYALEVMDHPGMNPECKVSILTWMQQSCAGVQREETTIQGVITTVRDILLSCGALSSRPSSRDAIKGLASLYVLIHEMKDEF